MTTATVNHAGQLPLVDALPVEHLFDMHVDLEAAQAISTPVGTRMTFIAKGGVIDGPKLQGAILPTQVGHPEFIDEVQLPVGGKRGRALRDADVERHQAQLALGRAGDRCKQSDGQNIPSHSELHVWRKP